MKKYLIAKVLRAGTYVKKVVQLDRPRTLNEFLAIAKTYIRYEEELYTDNLNKSRKEEHAFESSKKPFQEKKKEGKPAHEGEGPVGRFTEYMSLALSREKNPSLDCNCRSERSWDQTRQKLLLRKIREPIKQSIVDSTSVIDT